MPRRSRRNAQRQQIDYAQLADRVARVRRNDVEVENEIAQHNEAPLQPEVTSPVLTEGVFQCSSCKM